MGCPFNESINDVGLKSSKYLDNFISIAQKYDSI